jgi:hypothetical protein
MNTSIKQFASAIVVASVIAGCGSPASPAPSSASPSPSSAVVASSTSPRTATSAPSPTTALDPPAGSAALPIRGSAREISAQEPRLAPGADGSLYVSIAVREGPAVLLLLDKSGQPRPGWPIAIKDATWCGVPFPIDDGSVRIVCDAKDLPPPESGEAEQRAFAFDAEGQPMKGWPVRLKAPTAIGMGDDLTVLTEHRVEDSEGNPISHDVVVSNIAGDGTVRDGTPVALDLNRYGDQWAIGRDGVAVGVGDVDDDAEIGVITAVDSSGVRAGWPAATKGYGSAPAFGRAGQIAVTLGSAKTHTSRVSVFDQDGKAASSAVLSFPTAERTGDTGGCTASLPYSPVVAENGAIFAYGELDHRIYGLGPSLAVLKGWPFEPTTPLAVPRPGLESEHEAGYCPAPAVPAAGSDGTLFLALRPRTAKIGGSLVAVGKTGQVRPGWPVELKRPGSEFWAVTVGSDGTAYALAVEPEAGGKSSESILAISPDSTVRYTTTIIDP